MELQRLLLALTFFNLALLGSLVACGVGAQPDVLRGRALEIVDGSGNVKASLEVLPPTRTPDGQPYPETVILRLNTPSRGATVKLSASERGGILVLGGEANPTYVQLKAEFGETALTLSNHDGHVSVVKP